MEALQEVRLSRGPVASLSRARRRRRREAKGAATSLLSAPLTPSPRSSFTLPPRPGGVAVRSDLYYDITGAKAQVDSGDVTEECPQWNDVGAVDYAGKAAWEGHKRWTGKSADEARAAFCALFADAKEDRANNFF